MVTLISSLPPTSSSHPSAIVHCQHVHRLTHTMPFIARIKRILKKLSCFHNGNEETPKPITIVSSLFPTPCTLASTLTIGYSHFPTIQLLSWHSNVKARWSFKNLRAATVEFGACAVQWTSITSNKFQSLTIHKGAPTNFQRVYTELDLQYGFLKEPSVIPKDIFENILNFFQTRRGGTSRRRGLCGNKSGLVQHPCSGRATIYCRIRGQ